MKTNKPSFSGLTFRVHLVSLVGVAAVAGWILMGPGAQADPPAEHWRPFKAFGYHTVEEPNPDDPSTGVWEIVGNATHLGKFVANGTWITQFWGLEEALLTIEGTYTAANGDTLDVVSHNYVINLTTDPWTATATVHIVGGTGRFKDATGSYDAFVDYGYPLGSSLTAIGSISY